MPSGRIHVRLPGSNSIIIPEVSSGAKFTPGNSVVLMRGERVNKWVAVSGYSANSTPGFASGGGGNNGGGTGTNPTTPVVAPPTGVTVNGGPDSIVTVAFVGDQYADWTYEVQVSTDLAQTNVVGLLHVAGTMLYYGVAASTTRYFAWRSVDINGARSAWTTPLSGTSTASDAFDVNTILTSAGEVLVDAAGNVMVAP